MPSVVVSLRDAHGADVASGSIQIDDNKDALPVDGRPIPLDPGEHVFRASISGKLVGERRALIRSGERGRLIDVRASGQEPTTTRVPTPQANPNRGLYISPAAWTFGALSLASIGVFTVLGVQGQNDAASLRAEPCAQTATCSPSDVGHVRAKLIGADVALGVAVLAASVDIWIVVSQTAAHRSAATTVGVSTTGHEASATIRIPWD